MNLGDVIALDAVTYRDGVKAERFRQHIQGLLVTHRDVHPYNSVWTFEQLRELFNLMPLQTCIAHKQDIHTFTALPAKVAFAPVIPELGGHRPGSRHGSIQLCRGRDPIWESLVEAGGAGFGQVQA